MKTIPLTRGYVTIVDDADFEWLSNYKWRVLTPPNCHTAYAITGTFKNGTMMLMHRLILGLTTPSEMGDHRNGDGLNNQRYNLRQATRQQNQMHQRVQPNPRKSSVYKGVTWDKQNKKWRAYVECLGKRRQIGRYVSEVEAAHAYNAAALELHGEFAWLNTVPAPSSTGDTPCA